MPYGAVSGKPFYYILGKYIGHKAHLTMVVEFAAIGRNYSRAFLPPVLQCIKPKVCEICSLWMAEYAEYPAFIFEFIEHSLS